MASFLERFFGRSNAVTVEGRDRIPNNPAGGEFLDAVQSAIGKSVDRYSITANQLSYPTNSLNRGGISAAFGSSGALVQNSDVDIGKYNGAERLTSAMPVDTNKVQRIQAYDNIARYPELDWCLNEIANDFLHEDINGDFLKLKFKCPDDKFTDGQDSVLQEEFKHLVSLYDLRTTGYNMIRKFLIEGELCFENVVDYNHPEYGVIGFKYMPTMFYDFLRNRYTGQIDGIYVDPERLKAYAQFSSYGGGVYGGQQQTVFNAVRAYPAYSYTYSLDMKNKVAMPFEQVTYMNSGVLSEDGSVVFPAIEKVCVPVRQLLLMHDAMVIYRITRAPEKLVFNMDMSGMPAKKAEAKVREIAMAHKSRKAVQGSGSVTNVYNAETMLDAYYFWKIGDGGGTQVSTLQGTTNYNEMNDVKYFLHRLFKFMCVPWQRWEESAANRQDKQSIMNEEYSFAQMIVRYQQMFASAVKKTYITHLRMKGLFRKYDLHESDIEVTMIPPALYEMYQAQTRFKDALDIINSAASTEFLSKNLLLKTVFNWTDAEVKENEVETRREILLKAQTEWMAEQIKAGSCGANVYLDNEKYAQGAQGAQPGMEGGGAPMDMGAVPPEGGMPPPTGDQGGMPPPEGMAPPPPTEGQPAAEPAAAATPENPEAAANFQEFDNNTNIMQSNASEVDLTADEGGKTAAEKELPQNAEYGDFGELNKEKKGGTAKVYPETDRGIDALDDKDGKNAMPSMRSVFKDTLGDKVAASGAERTLGGEGDSMTSILHSSLGTEKGANGEGETMMDVFRKSFETEVDKAMRKSENEEGKRTMMDVFDDSFKGKRSRGTKKLRKSMKDVFGDSFYGGKSKYAAKEEREERGGKKSVPLSKALKRMLDV